MNRVAMLSSAAALAMLSPAIVAPFAAEAPAAAKAKRAKAPAPEISDIVSGIEIPKITRAAGTKSPFPWDKLEVGQSFGVVNKTVKQMSSIVSNVNRHKDNQRQKVGADGQPEFKTVNVTDAAGNVVAGMTKSEPVMEQIKTFVLAEVDPKKDPAKARVRVWRKQ